MFFNSGIKMSFIDIIFSIILGLAVYKGIKNGLFVEVASFISLLAGIYLAIQFSTLVGTILSSFFTSWNPKYIEIVAFISTFALVVFSIHYAAKLVTKIVDFAYLGWINKMAGITFSVLKTILALSVALFVFEKININNMILSKETQEQSIYYQPIQQISKWIYPAISEWYSTLKSDIK